MSKQFITTAPLAFLKPIKAKDLISYQTYKGKYIKLSIVNAFQISAVQMDCVDDNQDKVRLSVYNFKFNNQPYTHYFYPGRTIYIKQPFFKQAMNGGDSIKVDNPSDVQFQFVENFSIQNYKQEAKKLVKQQKYVEAYCSYKQLLEKCQKNQQKINILLNISLMCFKLDLKQQYGNYLRQIIKLNPTNQKAHYHLFKHQALCSTIPTRISFNQLRDHLKNNKYISKQSKPILVEFINYNQKFRLNQNIDWAQSIKTLTTGQYFSPKFKIGSGKYGRGLFATKDIQSGQIIIIQKPIFTYDFKKIQHTQFGKKFNNMDSKAAFLQFILPFYQQSNQFRNKINSLSQKYTKPKKDSPLTILQKVQLQQILAMNIFDDIQFHSIINKNLKYNQLGYFINLYQNICKINHQCQSNSDKFNIGPSGIVYATKNIKSGQQITISYRLQTNLKDRTRKLQRWGFQCECLFCNEQRASQMNIKVYFKSKSIYLYDILNSKNPSVQIQKITTDWIMNNMCHLQIAKKLYATGAQIALADKIICKILSISRQNLQNIKKLIIN